MQMRLLKLYKRDSYIANNSLRSHFSLLSVRDKRSSLLVKYAFIIKQVTLFKSSLLLKINLQNTQTLQSN
jgi:hypothetical protein